MRIYDPESSYWIQFNFVYSKHSEKKNKCYCREKNLFKLFTLIQRLLILIIHQLAISDEMQLYLDQLNFIILLLKVCRRW